MAYAFLLDANYGIPARFRLDVFLSIASYAGGLLFAYILFVVVLGRFIPIAEDAGIHWSMVADMVIGLISGIIIVYTGSAIWLSAYLGIFAVAYVDYTRRWLCVSRKRHLASTPRK